MNISAGDRPALRLASIDAYRGAVMLLMMGEVLHFCAVSQSLPGSGFWKFLLRSDRSPAAKVRWLGIAGVAGLTSGWILGVLGVCPVVKSIWTPSWVLFSGGWCFLFLAGAYTVVDIWGPAEPGGTVHNRWHEFDCRLLFEPCF